jgi:squalene-hopene/tetraprenyl-beta-curcumene cyclase
MMYIRIGENSMSRLRSIPWLTAWLVMVCIANSAWAAEPAYRETWNAGAAHEYLQQRAEWWLEWKEAQKAHGTVCLSCHTTVPFLLARATLGGKTPAAKDDAGIRLLASAKKRLTDWETIKPYTASSIENARGTESVLNAFALAWEDARLGASQSSDDTQRAIAALWKQQETEGGIAGAWRWYDYSLAPWEAKSEYFGAALAAVAVATAPGYLSTAQDEDLRHIELLREYLRSNFSRQNLHQRLMGTWASTKLPKLLSADEQQQVVREARAKQNADGGWSAAALGEWKYRQDKTAPTESDGYGTAFVVATLKSIARGEQQPVLERGLTWLRRHQRADDGSWPAASLNSEHPADSGEFLFMRDAATGWAILALEETKR